MQRVLVILVGCILAVGAHAQGTTPAAPTPPATTSAEPPTCKSQATDKKLAGAALNSFMKKCESDATAACDTSATEKKLFGAAKTSFTKKCVTDAVGG